MIINQENETGNNIVNGEGAEEIGFIKKIKQYFCRHDFYTTNKEFALFHCRKCHKLAADYFNN